MDSEIFGLLIARYRIAGYACELAAPSSGHLWGFPDQPSSRSRLAAVRVLSAHSDEMVWRKYSYPH